MKNYKSILATAATLLLLQCTGGEVIGPPPEDNTQIKMSVFALRIDSMANATLNWTPGADDGFGALDGFIVSVTDTITPDNGVVPNVDTVPEVARTATLSVGPYAINSPAAGTACIVSLRRGLTSSPPVCKPWAANFGDVPPPAPILDTVITNSTFALRDTLALQLNYRLSPDDSNGVYTLSTIVYDVARTHIDSTDVTPVIAGSRTRKLYPYTPGSTVTGTACVITARRSLVSRVCKPFSKVMYDQAPPPPVVDTVSTTSTSALRDTLSGQTNYHLTADDGLYTLKLITRDNGGLHTDSINPAVTPLTGRTRQFKLYPYGYGTTVNGTSCLTATRRGQTSVSCKPFTQVMYDQPPPPPVVNIQALIVKPDSLSTVDPGGTDPIITQFGVLLLSANMPTGPTQQYCTFVQFADGQIAMRIPDKSITYCQNEYLKFPLVNRSPTAGEQAVADTVTIVYSVERVN
jgi:hypothetical protein